MVTRKPCFPIQNLRSDSRSKVRFRQFLCFRLVGLLRPFRPKWVAGLVNVALLMLLKKACKLFLADVVAYVRLCRTHSFMLPEGSRDREVTTTVEEKMSIRYESALNVCMRCIRRQFICNPVFK